MTVGPVVENEPHHMQYMWHKGDSIFAGGLYSDITYVFDVKALPEIKLTGVNLPTDTPCGSIPDAYWTLRTAPRTARTWVARTSPVRALHQRRGPGQQRLRRLARAPWSASAKNGKTLSEVPAALPSAEDPTATNYPALPHPTCANPHGIQAREDLNRLITSDYAEPRNIVLDPVREPDPYLSRDTVRIWDITERDNAKLISVSHMPDGPDARTQPAAREPRGIMEVGVTNLPQHKGAFVVVHVRWRHLLHARHHRRRPGVARGLGRHGVLRVQEPAARPGPGWLQARAGSRPAWTTSSSSTP